MSGTTSKSNKAAALAHVQALIAGTLKHFPNEKFTIGNVVYTTSSLVQALQTLVDAMTALNAAQTGAKDALTALQGLEPNVRHLIQGYVRLLRAAFNNAVQTLSDFGVQPPKARTPLTSEEKAAAAAKLRATRSARGTTSRKKKLAISGDVTGVIVTPITAPGSPPVQPASPAPSAAPTASASK